MRTIWKGRIQFGMVTIPVRVFNASSPEADVKFSQLHKDCNGAIGMKRYCKKCNKEVEPGEVALGYEYSPSLYVVMEDADFASINLSITKVIEVQGFVRASEIPPSLYEAPYFLGPDGSTAPGAYGVLRDAMRETAMVGIGKVVMGNREVVVAISPEEDGILLHRLRDPNVLREVSSIPGLSDTTAVDDKQVMLTRVLIEYMTKPLSDVDLNDRYRSAVFDVIARKVAGEKLIAVPEVDYPVVSLESALTMSIAQAQHKSIRRVATNTTDTLAAQPGKRARRSRKIQTVSRAQSPSAKTGAEEKKKV